MKVIRLSEVPHGAFYGPLPDIGVGSIKTQEILSESESKDHIIKNVIFAPGARNKSHTHTCDQVLIVTGGRGLVVTDEERRTVEAGDIVIVPAGEKHWHGAAEDSSFSHIFVLSAGERTTKLED